MDNLKFDFFNVLIGWCEGETSCLQNFWAWGSHLGEALDKVIRAAENSGIDNPIAREASLYDFDALPETVVTEDEGQTYIDDTIHAYPSEYDYALPYGVVKSYGGEDDGDEDYDTADITVGYEVTEEDDLIEISAVIEEHDLLDIYLALVGVLPDIQVFWIKIEDHWEEVEETAIYVNQQLDSQEKIAAFISQHELDTLKNGHVTITTYANAGATNVNISDHKTIVVLTYEPAIATALCNVLDGRGIKATANLISIMYGFHHWHYRHPEALDRQSLINHLQEHGFHYWEPDNAT